MYSIGWSGGTPGAVAGYTAAHGVANFDRTNFPSAWTTCSDSSAGLPSVATGADPQNFTTTSRGQIRQDVGCDVWQITDEKFLTNEAINL